MKYRFQLALIVATMVASSSAAAAQPLKTGWLVGATAAREVGTAFAFPRAGPMAGATLQAELNSLVAFGMELDYVRKGGNSRIGDLNLDYMELPVSIQLSPPKLSASPQFFWRLGLAPSWMFRCISHAWPGRNPNTPETESVIGKLGEPLKLRIERACDANRENIDFAWQAGVGASLRRDRRHLSVELRMTNGLDNLSARHIAAIRSRVVSLVVSETTRRY